LHDFTCAVCSTLVTVDDFGMCNACHWEHDPVQERDPNYKGGANKRSLNEARAIWLANANAQPVLKHA